MRNRTLNTVFAGVLLLACGCATPREQPAGEQAQAAAAGAELDLFVAAPTSGVQLLFVGAQKSAAADEWPGSVFLPLSTFSVARNGIPNELPGPDSLAKSLASLGVRGDRFVIVGDPIPAGRAYAGFDYLGLGDRVALLDGGVNALRALAAKPAPAATTSKLKIHARDDMIVDAKWVHDRLNDPNVAILDARPPAEFTGEKPGEGITRPGHIPGARNVFWQTLVVSADDQRLKPEAELRRIFEQAGAKPGTMIVAYCRTGGQASFLYTVARHLGYAVRLYDGSFIDWNRTEYPVER